MSKFSLQHLTLKQPQQFKAVWCVYISVTLTLESLHFARGVYLCVLYHSNNKERLLLYREITDWCC